MRCLFYLFNGLNESECKEILNYARDKLKKVSKLSIAFFSDVKACLYDDYIWDSYKAVKQRIVTGDPLSYLQGQGEIVPINKEMIFRAIDTKVSEMDKGNQSYI